MPEPIRNEETETRIHSLCLFDFTNITVLNRCAHCPGAARTALQHRRCPRDVSQPNIFHPADPESSKIPTESGSPSSSKGKQKLHPEVDTLSEQTAALSLKESSTVPSIQQPDAKRKAISEPDGQSKGKKNYLNMEDYLRTKPLQMFRDRDFENPLVPGSRRVSDWTSLPGNVAPGSFVPGSLMNTSLGGYGVSACRDGMVEMDWQWNSEI